MERPQRDEIPSPQKPLAKTFTVFSRFFSGKISLLVVYWTNREREDALPHPF